MWVMYLRFALLVWIPAVLHAQSTAQPCSAPSLEGGFFLPVQESYPHGAKISYACDNGYKPIEKGWWATSTCIKGKWILTPHCRATLNSCTEPPKVLNAVIIDEDYQEVFVEDSEVEYQCKGGYVTEEGATKKSVFCRAGQWTEGPTCRLPSSSGSNEGDTKLAFVSIDHCGDLPNVPNSIREGGQRSLKYTCVSFYKLEGPETVVCQSDGTWSEVPTCREDFCEMNTADYPDLENVGVKYIKNGDRHQMECTNVMQFPNFSVVKCINGKLHKTRCCNRGQISLGLC
ncbi:complement factor H-like [Kryptolebias marmoratus]|uniref:complement factor H-like n=1 Tax=Kryptolebias marmoratus TaxID=37003 RepID=UPI0007F91E7B|nr:complement factor H-like [Kryptolebias marmoratus]